MYEKILYWTNIEYIRKEHMNMKEIYSPQQYSMYMKDEILLVIYINLMNTLCSVHIISKSMLCTMQYIFLYLTFVKWKSV
jgi:hypothetical protein